MCIGQQLSNKEDLQNELCRLKHEFDLSKQHLATAVENAGVLQNEVKHLRYKHNSTRQRDTKLPQKKQAASHSK